MAVVRGRRASALILVLGLIAIMALQLVAPLARPAPYEGGTTVEAHRLLPPPVRHGGAAGASQAVDVSGSSGASEGSPGLSAPTSSAVPTGSTEPGVAPGDGLPMVTVVAGIATVLVLLGLVLLAVLPRRPRRRTWGEGTDSRSRRRR